MFEGECNFHENQTTSIFNLFLEFKADTNFIYRISSTCFCGSVKDHLLGSSHLLPHNDKIKKSHTALRKIMEKCDLTTIKDTFKLPIK